MQHPLFHLALAACMKQLKSVRQCLRRNRLRLISFFAVQQEEEDYKSGGAAAAAAGLHRGT